MPALPVLFLLPERKPVARIVFEQRFEAVEFLGRGLGEFDTLGRKLLVGREEVVAFEDAETESAFGYKIAHRRGRFGGEHHPVIDHMR